MPRAAESPRRGVAPQQRGPVRPRWAWGMSSWTRSVMGRSRWMGPTSREQARHPLSRVHCPWRPPPQHSGPGSTFYAMPSRRFPAGSTSLRLRYRLFGLCSILHRLRCARLHASPGTPSGGAGRPARSPIHPPDTVRRFARRSTCLPGTRRAFAPHSNVSRVTPSTFLPMLKSALGRLQEVLPRPTCAPGHPHQLLTPAQLCFGSPPLRFHPPAIVRRGTASRFCGRSILVKGCSQRFCPRASPVPGNLQRFQSRATRACMRVTG